MAQVTLEEIDAWNGHAQEMTDLILGIPADCLDDVVVGEWSARQVMTHMLDSELVFSARLRTAIAEPGNSVSAFDPDAMATHIPYKSVSIEYVGQAFLALRAGNTEILKALPAAAWEQTIDHPEHGLQMLPDVVRVFGPHISSHMAELRAAQTRSR